MKFTFLILTLLCGFFQDPTSQELDPLLSQASKENDIEIVKLLLGNGANPNAQNGKALIIASIRGNTKILELLLEHGANPNAQDGQAHVMASIRGDTEIVELLLEHGANPNAQNGKALVMASLHGHTEVAELLLEHGADPKAQNGEALVTACRYRRPEICKLIIRVAGVASNAQEEEALIRACDKRYIEIILLSLQAKIELSEYTEDAFLRVCTIGHMRFVKHLMQGLGYVNTSAEAPLLAACERKQGTIAKLLLAVNINEDMRWRSATVLSYPQVLQLLAKSLKGAIVEFENIALESIKAQYFDEFTEFIDCTGIDLAENPSLLQEILFSGNYDFVKYAFEHIPNLQDAYLVGLSNYHFEYTEGTRNILHNYIKSENNNYLVQLSLPIVSDEKIIIHFSGLINPGAEDTYPRNENSFTLEDMDQERMTPQEILYHQVVKASKQHDIPYLGICAGAQHLTLGAAGSLIQKGHQGPIEISFFGGTIPHYLFLTDEERAYALVNCKFPDVIIDNAYAAHGYSAVPGMLGEGVLLGGISSEGIPEAFSLGANKIGVQFHPEHYHPNHIEYVNKPSIPALNRQKIFLENVFEMFEGYYKSMQYAKRAGLDRLEAKAAIAYANEKLVKTLQSCQATKLTPAQEALWAGVGSVDTPPAQHLYILPGITREDFAYTQNLNDLILYSTAKNGVLSARDFFPGNSTKSIYIHFADGSVFHLHNDDETAFEEGKSQFIE